MLRDSFVPIEKKKHENIDRLFGWSRHLSSLCAGRNSCLFLSHRVVRNCLKASQMASS